MANQADFDAWQAQSIVVEAANDNSFWIPTTHHHKCAGGRDFVKKERQRVDCRPHNFTVAQSINAPLRVIFHSEADRDVLPVKLALRPRGQAAIGNQGGGVNQAARNDNIKTNRWGWRRPNSVQRKDHESDRECNRDERESRYYETTHHLLSTPGKGRRARRVLHIHLSHWRDLIIRFDYNGTEVKVLQHALNVKRTWRFSQAITSRTLHFLHRCLQFESVVIRYRQRYVSQRTLSLHARILAIVYFCCFVAGCPSHSTGTASPAKSNGAGDRARNRFILKA
jgi:hypothetical protein